MPSALTMQAFLERVWPPTGPYLLAFPLRDKFPDKKDGYAHYANDTISDAVTRATLLWSRDKVNVYFGTHALKQGRVQNGTKADGSPKFKVHRTHENMREAVTFFSDLDVGPPPEDKKKPDFKYRTRDEALESLQRFIFRSGLPHPLVVDSGGGYHVYWLLDTPIESETWRTHADKMRWLFKHFGLKVDPSRVCDQSSVLRVVGTMNLKPHVNAKVRAMHVGDVTPTDEFLALLETKAKDYTPLAAITLKTSVVGNLGTMYDGRMTPPDEVFKVCGNMRTFRDSMGMLDEPSWFKSIGTMMWCEDGEELVHELSSGDPRYDHTETQNKIDNLRSKSVFSCSQIEASFGSAECDKCPFKGRGRNPLDIANKEWAKTVKPAATPTPLQLKSGVIPLKPVCDPGYPYQLTNEGVSVVVSKDGVDEMVRLIAYHLFPIANFKGRPGDAGHSRWCVTLPLEGQREFDIMNEDIHDTRQFAPAMMSVGVHLVTDAEKMKVKQYMLHYLRQLQAHTATTATFDFYGWAQDDNQQKTGFILHKRAFDLVDAKWKPVAMAHNMRDGDQSMTRAGSFSGHFDALKFFDRPQWRHIQFAYLAGLAAPWLYATGEKGALISLAGRSSASKSTALRAIIGQWGNTEKLLISGSPTGSTANARQDHIFKNANLPACFDEVTNQSTEVIQELILSVSQGIQRIALRNTGVMRERRGGERSSIVFVSTNTSLVTMISLGNAGEATLARCIEIDCPKGNKAEKSVAEDVIRALQANYGWTGPMMIERLAPQHEAIYKGIIDQSKNLNNVWALDTVERFTGFVAAVTYEIAVRTYNEGLHPFDPDGVIEWFGDVQLARQRQFLLAQHQKSSPVEVMSTYLARFHGEAIRIEVDAKGNIGGVLSVPNSREVVYRYDIGRGECWIRGDHFRKHLVLERHDAAHVISQLEQLKIIEEARFNLAESVPNHEPIRVRGYTVNMKLPQMTGVKSTVT